MYYVVRKKKKSVKPPTVDTEAFRNVLQLFLLITNCLTNS